ncbi:MAG: hypothetical protein AAF371_05985 [Pseudomonadota bacterium]
MAEPGAGTRSLTGIDESGLLPTALPVALLAVTVNGRCRERSPVDLSLFGEGQDRFQDRFREPQEGQALFARAVADGTAEGPAELLTTCGPLLCRISLWRQRGGERLRLVAAIAPEARGAPDAGQGHALSGRSMDDPTPGQAANGGGVTGAIHMREEGPGSEGPDAPRAAGRKGSRESVDRELGGAGGTGAGLAPRAFAPSGGSRPPQGLRYAGLLDRPAGDLLDMLERMRVAAEPAERGALSDAMAGVWRLIGLSREIGQRVVTDGPEGSAWGDASAMPLPGAGAAPAEIDPVRLLERLLRLAEGRARRGGVEIAAAPVARACNPECDEARPADHGPGEDARAEAGAGHPEEPDTGSDAASAGRAPEASGASSRAGQAAEAEAGANAREGAPAADGDHHGSRARSDGTTADAPAAATVMADAAALWTALELAIEAGLTAVGVGGRLRAGRVPDAAGGLALHIEAIVSEAQGPDGERPVLPEDDERFGIAGGDRAGPGPAGAPETSYRASLAEAAAYAATAGARMTAEPRPTGGFVALITFPARSVFVRH